MPPVSKSYEQPSSDSLANILSDSIDFRLRNTADALAQVEPLAPDFEAIAGSVFSLADEGAIINVLRLYNENTSVWSLKICAIILNPSQERKSDELGVYVKRVN